jgi:Helix-turn-helix domain
MSDQFEVRDKRSGFLWVSNRIFDTYAPKLQSTTFIVYLALCRLAGNDNQECYPTQARLAEMVNMSERTIRSALDELEKEGLLTVQVLSRGGQKNHCNLYTLTEPANFAASNFEPAKKDVRSGNGLPVPIRKTQTLEQDLKTNTGFSLSPPSEKQPFILPSWVPLEPWNAFLEMRRRMKKPPGEYAQRLLIKKLETLRANGETVGDVIDNSIANGYLGFFGVKDRNNGINGKTSRPDTLPPDYVPESVKRKRELEERKAQGW